MCDRAIWLTHGNDHRRGRSGRPRRRVHREDARRPRPARRRQHPPRLRRDPDHLRRAVRRRRRHPVKRFRTGDDVRIRMHYQADKPVPKPVFGFAIEALGGATVTAPCTRDVGLIPEALSRRRHDRGRARRRVAAARHVRPAHIDHRLQPVAHLRQPAPRVALRRDDRQAVRVRRPRHRPPAVDDRLISRSRIGPADKGHINR